MSRAVALVIGFVGGAVTASLAIYLSLRAGPEVIAAGDAMDALAVAASSHLAGFRSGEVVYVKSSFGTDLIEKIRPLYPSLRLLPYSARPLDDGCNGSGNSRPLAPCESNDFLIIDALSSPTTRTMLVGFSNFSGGGQLLLFHFGGRWRIVIDRSTVI